MRLAVLSDIHGNWPALQAVVAEVEAARVDLVLNLGDILSGPLWPVETAQWLMQQAWPTIAGNHERQLLDTRQPQGASDAFAARALGDAPGGDAQKAWLAALPAALALAEGDIRLCHGTPLSDHEPLLETVTADIGRHGSPGVRAAMPAEVQERLGDTGSATLLLCGHSHQPRVLALGGLLVVNPGSVGLPAYEHDQPHRHRVETGSPHARWAIVERSAQGWRVEQRLTAYDWRAAAAKAEAEGRGDWADALASGRVGRMGHTETELS
jgi:predicted phosphodiesterase